MLRLIAAPRTSLLLELFPFFLLRIQMASDIGTLLDTIGYHSSTLEALRYLSQYGLLPIIIVTTYLALLLLLLTLTPSSTILCYFTLAMLLHAAVTPCSFVFELCFCSRSDSLALGGPYLYPPLIFTLHYLHCIVSFRYPFAFSAHPL